ncbi:MAG: asparagine synthase (glutamine-hydrolyzing) [Acidobacteriota bacterium]|jgi:asparagine synthase (glutamine-hydrolysing)
MCGIAGYTHRRRAAVAGRIEAATQALHHRGPDQWGVHRAPEVSLGAVRLRIIDLAGGEQPIYSADRDTVIVFNGEIYNYGELREELLGRGRHFHTHSDTEVVLQGFLEWDTGVFSRLRGMFGVALWTESQRRLVLARDRMGIKPLYLCRHAGELYFGSELKAILAHPEIPRRISRPGLNAFLQCNYIPAPYTMIDGIEKLPPGHWLEWRAGQERVAPYWRLEYSPVAISLEAAKEELDRLLRAAVREHLIADVPLGIWASGGVDSTAVLHYAAEAAPGRLKTFSVSFAGRKFDESPWFREVAQRYGTDHHEFDCNPSADLADAVSQFAYYSDEPSADAGALPVWYLSRMTRQHVTVALSGEGADELFGGYYTYLADEYARRIRPLPGKGLGLRLAKLLLPVSDEKISFEYKVKRFLQGAQLDPVAAHLYWNGTFTAAEREQLVAGRWFAPLHTPPPFRDFLELDQNWYLPDDILYKCDRMSMAHSLEVRPPFLDHRIVEFAARLPYALKIRGSELKYLPRQLLRGKVPASVLDRKKEGFDIPAHDWFRTALRPLLEETLRTPNPLFRPGAVERVLDDHLARRGNYGYHLWGLLTLFLWIKRWNVDTN